MTSLTLHTIIGTLIYPYGFCVVLMLLAYRYIVRSN